MNHLINDIIAALNSYADAQRIEFAKKSYPTKMRVIGVTNPNLKKVLKEVKLLTKDYTVKDKYKLATQLIDTNIFECQQLAYEYIGNDKKNIKELNSTELDYFFKNMDNWVSVDYFGVLFVGYAWRENIIDLAKVKSYLESDNKWIRRIAVVATVTLNQKARGGTGDAERTLQICKEVVSDHEDMITKALSWALRELAKRNPQAVSQFIHLHKNELHKRVWREVNNKLNFGVKNL